MSEELVMIKRAIISVSDKTGVKEFAESLLKRGVEIISTGGTVTHLLDKGINVTEVSNITDFPELMDGRLKTLHPNIHGGLLAIRDNEEHIRSMKKHNIPAIDLLVVNLYPFERAIAEEESITKIIENVDVGGPAMIRAAAKNYKYVSVLVDLDDYQPFLNEIDKNKGCTRLSFREELAEIAFSRTAEYDSIISQWMISKIGERKHQVQEKFPRRFVMSAKREKKLRYGENPHQEAAYYQNNFSKNFLSRFTFHQGKELSFNNITDINCALGLLSSFDEEPGVVAAIIKHGNTCGVAIKDNPCEAYLAAYDCDRSSSFGGIIVINDKLDIKTANLISKVFTEVVLVPKADPEAISILSEKKNLRLITWPKNIHFQNGKLNFKQVWGGVLIQDYDYNEISENEFSIVTKVKPTEEEIADMKFAWKVAKHIKSNAIVFAKNLATVGIGAGQMSRIDSTRIATFKAEDMSKILGYKKSCAKGSVAASDAFFPFPDGIFQLASAGVSSVIQPGGSINDNKVIEAANKVGISMVFTNVRHFNH